ncbi:Predicted small metal-binding protein [Nocardioides scoriae]|uniref:Predicted small metal-binding protein n=1 Tax=Nocardioides scoriae TaxID=642780 RepID=A0A1H1LLR1_9ACTN|nr:DUF1059 domain-containing protein [Nocardioides scoriae]SDR74799.1 Predicted small metal-binding protein [Nocardioides scoriae]
MIFKLACGDVMPGCASTFENIDRTSLMQDVAAHAASDHGITEITPDVHAAINGHVQALPA